MAEVKLELKEELSPDPLLIKVDPELSIKQEPEEFPFRIISVKSEYDEDASSVLHQRPTEEKREETNGEDCGVKAGCSSDPPTQFLSDGVEQTDSSDLTDHSEDWFSEKKKVTHSNTSQFHSESEEPTDHSEDYSDEEAPAKRSYAMIPPDYCVTDHRPSRSPDQGPFSCTDCGKRFKYKSRLQRHATVHTKQDKGEKKENKCSVCEKIFARRNYLQTHMKIHTGEKPSICSICDKGFVQKSDLIRHQTHVHHLCPVCSKCSTDWKSFREHLKTHVDEGTLDQSSFIFREMIKSFNWSDQGPPSCIEKNNKCSVCEKTFGQKSHLKTHMKIHTGEKSFICTVCEKAFVQKSQLTRHQTCVHHICPVCSKGFSDRNSLGEHMKIHVNEGTLDQSSVLFRDVVKLSSCSESLVIKNSPDSGEKPLMCPVCDRTFSQRLALLLHKKLIHKICPVCPQQLLNKFTMNVHLRVHLKDGTLHPDSALLKETENPFVGSDQRSFTCPEAFVTNHRPFNCAECGESFNWDSQLQEHISHHRKERPHKCSVCEKSFVLKSGLTRHQTLIHHICSVCSKSFSDRISLNEHLKIHVEEGILDPSDLIIETVKPFTCPECSKGFMLKSQFEVHVLNHKRERPHKCPVCAKTFIQKYSLNVHVKIHRGHRPFNCSVCEKGFVHKADVTRHQAFVHHICPVCCERFSDRISVKDHLRTHLDEGTLDPSTFLIRVMYKTYSCPECGKAFTKKCDLKKHMLSHAGHV